jgi:hypothetical protein
VVWGFAGFYGFNLLVQCQFQIIWQLCTCYRNQERRAERDARHLRLTEEEDSKLKAGKQRNSIYAYHQDSSKNSYHFVLQTSKGQTPLLDLSATDEWNICKPFGFIIQSLKLDVFGFRNGKTNQE